MGWLLFLCFCAETSHAGFARLSTSQVDLIIVEMPVPTFVGQALERERWKPSSLLASASSERLANQKGAGCSKAEPQMKQVGEGGVEAE